MKNIIIIAILLFSCRSLKQERVINIPIQIRDKSPLIEGRDLPYKPLFEFNYDTLKYVEANFLHRNGAYINKPLDTLLADLEIPVVGFLVGVFPKNNYLSRSVSLSFFTDAKVDSKLKKHENPVILVVEWATPLPSEEVLSLVSKSHNVWNKEVRQYFSSKIIANIEMVKM